MRDKPFKGWKADHLFYTDNGRILCGKHLGMSAMYSRRDISGQKIARVSKADEKEFQVDFGIMHVCETCRSMGRK